MTTFIHQQQWCTNHSS